jgi:hypothetical protein
MCDSDCAHEWEHFQKTGRCFRKSELAVWKPHRLHGVWPPSLSMFCVAAVLRDWHHSSSSVFYQSRLFNIELCKSLLNAGGGPLLETFLRHLDTLLASFCRPSMDIDTLTLGDKYTKNMCESHLATNCGGRRFMFWYICDDHGPSGPVQDNCGLRVRQLCEDCVALRDVRNKRQLRERQWEIEREKKRAARKSSK